jgi:hypothetical protein
VAAIKRAPRNRAARAPTPSVWPGALGHLSLNSSSSPASGVSLFQKCHGDKLELCPQISHRSSLAPPTNPSRSLAGSGRCSAGAGGQRPAYMSQTQLATRLGASAARRVLLVGRRPGGARRGSQLLPVAGAPPAPLGHGRQTTANARKITR